MLGYGLNLNNETKASETNLVFLHPTFLDEIVREDKIITQSFSIQG